MRWMSEMRADIKYFFQKGLSTTNNPNEVRWGVKDLAPSFSTVDKWTGEFNCGRKSLK